MILTFIIIIATAIISIMAFNNAELLNKLKFNAPLNDNEEIDVLYCTAKPVNSKEQPGSDTGQAELNAKRFDHL